MREAIITIVTDGKQRGTHDDYPVTQIFRVEFEGDFGITGESDNTDTFEFKKVVNSEQLKGDPQNLLG